MVCQNTARSAGNQNGAVPDQELYFESIIRRISYESCPDLGFLVYYMNPRIVTCRKYDVFSIPPFFLSFFSANPISLVSFILYVSSPLVNPHISLRFQPSFSIAFSFRIIIVIVL